MSLAAIDVLSQRKKKAPQMRCEVHLRERDTERKIKGDKTEVKKAG